MPTQRVNGIIGFAIVWVVLLYTSIAAAQAGRAPTESRLDRELAAALRTAVRAALRENCVTPDLGGSKSTAEMGDWLMAKSVEALTQQHSI